MSKSERESRTTYIVDDIDKFHCEKCWFKIESIDITHWNYCPKCGAEIDSWQSEELGDEE